jgi:hypothetical protein
MAEAEGAALRLRDVQLFFFPLFVAFVSVCVPLCHVLSLQRSISR